MAPNQCSSMAIVDDHSRNRPATLSIATYTLLATICFNILSDGRLQYVESWDRLCLKVHSPWTIENIVRIATTVQQARKRAYQWILFNHNRLTTLPIDRYYWYTIDWVLQSIDGHCRPPLIVWGVYRQPLSTEIPWQIVQAIHRWPLFLTMVDQQLSIDIHCRQEQVHSSCVHQQPSPPTIDYWGVFRQQTSSYVDVQ